EADLALGPFGLTQARAKAVQFSQPLMIDYWRIMVRLGKAKPDPWGFFKPLGGLVFVYTLLCLVVVGILLGALEVKFVMPYGTTWNKICTISDQLFDAYTTLMQQ
ncbi:unnamed protein product, partial [Meganyctiphanes norvegica]